MFYVLNMQYTLFENLSKKQYDHLPLDWKRIHIFVDF